MAKESNRDPLISAVMRYLREGWPHNIDSEDIRITNAHRYSLNREWVPTLWSKDSHPRLIAGYGQGTSTFRPFWSNG